MKHVVAISKKPVLATTTTTPAVTVDTKISFITNILNAFEPLLTAKAGETTTTT